MYQPIGRLGNVRCNPKRAPDNLQVWTAAIVHQLLKIQQQSLCPYYNRNCIWLRWSPPGISWCYTSGRDMYRSRGQLPLVFSLARLPTEHSPLHGDINTKLVRLRSLAHHCIVGSLHPHNSWVLSVFHYNQWQWRVFRVQAHIRRVFSCNYSVALQARRAA